MTASSLIVWADVETTGLKPGRPDKLLEIAVYITDKNLNILEGSKYHAVVYHENPQDVRLLANDYVDEMHAKTGLWDVIGKVSHTKPLAVIEQQLYDHIRSFAPDARTARLAGNSVRLDLAFIDEFLPSISAHLHYRILDVSSLAFEAYDVAGFTPFTKLGTHSADADIKESIAELDYIRGCLRYGDYV